MAGTLTISTLSDGTNSTSATNCIQGSAKAWVNFNGTTGTIRASFNVSSITVNATGDYTVNFTTSMPNVNYSVNGAVSYGAARAVTIVLFTQSGGTASAPTTSTFRFLTLNTANGIENVSYLCLSVFSA